MEIAAEKVRRTAALTTASGIFARGHFWFEMNGLATRVPTGLCFELFGADSKTLNKSCRALEAAGVEFTDENPEHGLGVRLQKGKPAGKRK